MTEPYAGAALQRATTDLAIAVLKPLEDVIDGLKVRSLIEDNLTTPYILARSANGAWNSDSFHDSDRRFLRRIVLDVQVFTSGLDADTSADALSELCWHTLYQAMRNQTVIPKIGSIAYLRTSSAARRVSDWATSTGVNQYANLTMGYTRYQATYGIVQRPDRLDPLTAAELVALASLSS